VPRHVDRGCPVSLAHVEQRDEFTARDRTPCCGRHTRASRRLNVCGALECLGVHDPEPPRFAQDAT
jgi:hypothetical protein